MASEKIETDEVGRSLIESYFVYRDEYVESRMYQCPNGHLRLCLSRLGYYSEDADDHIDTCSRSENKNCGLPMKRYIPDDEGLDALGWAKRMLRRESRDREIADAARIRLEDTNRRLMEVLKKEGLI